MSWVCGNTYAISIICKNTFGDTSCRVQIYTRFCIRHCHTCVGFSAFRAYSFRNLQTARSIKGAFTPGTRLGGAPAPRGTESCRGRHSRCSFRTGEKLTVHVLVGVPICCRTHRIQTISFLDSADILELSARGGWRQVVEASNHCNI